MKDKDLNLPRIGGVKLVIPKRPGKNFLKPPRLIELSPKKLRDS